MTHIKTIKLCSSWNSLAAHASPHRGKARLSRRVAREGDRPLPESKAGEGSDCAARHLACCDHYTLAPPYAFLRAATAADPYLRMRESEVAGAGSLPWTSGIRLWYLRANLCYRGLSQRPHGAIDRLQMESCQAVPELCRMGDSMGNKVDPAMGRFTETSLVALMIF